MVSKQQGSHGGEVALRTCSYEYSKLILAFDQRHRLSNAERMKSVVTRRMAAWCSELREAETTATKTLAARLA
jgi:hypothetical protein